MILKKSKIFHISIFFIIALIISSWFAISTTKNMLTQKKLQKDNPDFFMRNVVYTQLAEDGSMQNQLYSPHIIHYPLADTYTFDTPQMIMMDTSKHSWKINANKGVGKKNGQEVFLWDNVNIVQQGELPGQEVMKVVTSAATIYPEQKKAYTDKPLTITQAGTVVNAVGAEVDFRSSSIKLLSKVQGQYAGDENKH
jgi:lipopolysaccharide export system protein LptC